MTEFEREVAGKVLKSALVDAETARQRTIMVQGVYFNDEDHATQVKRLTGASVYLRRAVKLMNKAMP